MKNTQDTKLLQDTLDQLIGLKGIRHAIFSVESLDGSFKWAGAKGMSQSDGTPMDVDTPFWIASITKLFIASTILKLHEAHKLSIDNLVIQYLPEDMLRGVHVIKGVDYYNQLTIRHLLSHSSGIPDYLEIKSDNNKTIIDEILEGDDKTWTTNDVLQIVRKAQKPLFEPQLLTNSKYRVHYSDTNFQILIAIIETITHQNIETAFREYLFKPLNLTHTFHPGSLPLSQSKHVATVWIEDLAFENKPLGIRSFGDLNSTLADLTAFMRALITGKVFQNKQTLDMMCGMWQTFDFGFSLLAPGWPIQYGLGMMRFKIPRFMTPFSPIPDLIGHTGATGSWLFYCAELELIFAGTLSQVTAAPVPFKVIPKLLKAFK